MRFFFLLMLAGCSRADRPHAVVTLPSATGSSMAHPQPALLEVRTGDGQPFLHAGERLAHEVVTIDCTSKTQSLTCADFLADAGCTPTTTLAQIPWTSARLQCGALELVAQAKPAQRSFLRSFVLGPDALALLPATVLAVPSPDREKEIAAAAANGKSVRDVQPKLATKTTSHIEALYMDADVWLRLTLFGFADVDGDGNEDVIVGARSGVAQGSWSSGSLWVLSRDTPTGMLKIVRRS